MWRVYFLLLLFTSCGEKRGQPEPPASQLQRFKDATTSLTPGDLLVIGATLAAGFAVAGLLAVPFLIWFGQPRLARMVGGLCVGYIVCAPILIWFGNNLTWIAIVFACIAACIGVYWAWYRGVPWLESRLQVDLNKDGHIGHG